MYPKKIFGLFYLYGLFIAIGIIACFLVFFQFGKKRKIEEKFVDFVFYNAIAAIIVGFGTASLFQATYNYIDDPSQGFRFDGGITFIGGLIGGIASFLIGYWMFKDKFKARIVDIVSIAPCCILIAHAFGRIGCLFAGCCHGAETDAWYGIYMPAVGAKVVPTQLFEAIFLFALFAVCYLLYWKKNFKHNLSLYLLAYGIFRFLIEFFRADERGQFLFGISPSQFWSIVMVLSSVAVYFLLEYLYKRRDAELAAEKALAEDTETVAEDTETLAEDTETVAENTEEEK